MADLIDRQAAIDAVHYEWDLCLNFDGSGTEIANDTEKALCDVPSADIDLSGFSDKLWKTAYERGKAEVVRCKDCRYGHRYFDIIYDTTDSWVECINPDGLNRDVSEDSFCSAGERKDG